MVRVHILESDAQDEIWLNSESDSKFYALGRVIEILCASISFFENGDDDSNTRHLKNCLRSYITQYL